MTPLKAIKAVYKGSDYFEFGCVSFIIMAICGAITFGLGVNYYMWGGDAVLGGFKFFATLTLIILGVKIPVFILFVCAYMFGDSDE